MRKQIITAWGLASLCMLSLIARVAAAEDAYYEVPIQDLKLTAGKLPTGEPAAMLPLRWSLMQYIEPRVVLDGQGEAYVFSRGGDMMPRGVNWRDGGTIAIKAAADKDVTGRLFLPKDDFSGMVALKFSVPAAAARADARQRFLRAKYAHYTHLLDNGAPGGAWFRHERQVAQSDLVDSGVKDLPIDRPSFSGSPSTFDDAYALFSGGRAVSENLQLDRALPATAARGDKTKVDEVDISAITGITVREMDWQALTSGLKPAVDPLAASIPSDQHVIFFPTFSAAMALSDEADREGTPVLQLAEPRSEDSGALKRYQRQLGLSLSDAARLLGPQLIGSLALTGSDPYFRTGTDVALLMEAKDPAALAKLLLANITQSTQASPATKTTALKIQDIQVRARRSPDRMVSSYVAVVGRSVVLTNSQAQLERLVSVYKGTTPAISSLPEYTFFRHRYPRGDAQETALLFLSDATIRRWCGPRWRIASARRTLAAAVLADQQATHLDQLVQHKVAAPSELPRAASVIDLGQLRLAAGGVASSIYGSVEFATPIVELSIDRVTEAEKAGYERWRDTYQQNWRQFFDPIAVRFEIKDNRLAADLTVVPLILATDYRQFISLVQGAKIGPGAADPHDSLLQLVIAFNAKSEVVRQAGNFAMAMAPGVKVDLFGWLGESISVYLDDDPIWAELAKAKDSERSNFFGKNLGRLPVAIYAEVSNGFKLTAFLAALRAFIEQTAPGMTAWESLTYKELPYVKVMPTAQAGNLGLGDQLALYYYASGEAFILTLNEDVLKRAIDRQLARRQAKPQGKEPAGDSWLGSSVALHADAKLLGLLRAAGGFLGNDYQSLMQGIAWANLPILNAWRSRYPDQDPLKVHETFTHVRLVCPGGGKYVWSDEWQTMQSTVYGHPGEPKSGPPLPAALESVRAADFGLTFEEHGLRARASIDRQATSK
jgi:hypothetical protein